MIDYISGTIADLSPTRVVVDNHGMGYGLEISLQTYESLQGNTQAKVYALTTINQRDATEVMYGFATKDERELFELITGISGIGAASARMILSSMSSEEFREAILSENVNKITAWTCSSDRTTTQISRRPPSHSRLSVSPSPTSTRLFRASLRRIPERKSKKSSAARCRCSNNVPRGTSIFQNTPVKQKCRQEIFPIYGKPVLWSPDGNA